MENKCVNCIHFYICVRNGDTLPHYVVRKNYVCSEYQDKSLFVELPCEWGKDVYTIVKGYKTLLKTKLFAIGITEEGYITYNPSEYPKSVFGINGVILGENTFPTKEEAEAKLKELENNKNG